MHRRDVKEILISTECRARWLLWLQLFIGQSHALSN